MKIFRFMKGDDTVTSAEIKRNLKIFSVLFGGFVLATGLLIAYKFSGINNTLTALIVPCSILISVLCEKMTFRAGRKLVSRWNEELLNEIVIIKWGKAKVAGFSALTILSSIVFFLVFVLVFVPGIEVVAAENVILGAHRGSSVSYIENTLPAFEEAASNEEYKFIEFDVLCTKDKQLVVHHDKSLLRLQEKNVEIADVTYEELESISDYHIPTYWEVMDLVAGVKPLDIEIKSQGNLTEDFWIVDTIITDVTKRGIFNETLFSSVSSDIVEYYSLNYPEAKTGKVYWISTGTLINFEDLIDNIYEEAERIGADYLMIHASNLRIYEQLKELQPRNVSLAIWYFDDRMYLIPPKDREIVDGGGNIIGFVVRKLFSERNWSLEFFGKEILEKQNSFEKW